jgi:hypothetical protein
MRLYVANLPATTSEADLATLFAWHGRVSAAAVWSDLDSDPNDRFGVVYLDDDGEAARSAIDGMEYRGRRLVVGATAPGAAPV